MFAKKICQWNAVDVVRSNGEVHRGLVVDKQESHLLVDFEIAGKKPELVPCQNACLSNDPSSRDVLNFDRTDSTVILRKLSKDQPWKWCPGTVLVFRPFVAPSFTLVEMRIGDQVITDCVRSDCVRRATDTGRSMRKNDFLREECSVPEGFSYDAQSITPWRKRFPRTHPIGVVDDTLHFLQLRYDKDLDVDEMTSALIDGIPKDDEMDTTEDHRGVKRPHENITSNEDSEASDNFSISDLPLDILGVMFSFLDGRQQTRMRRVCPVWNSKILSPVCSREMILDFSLRLEKDHSYILGAWLFHCITKWTKYVMITVSDTEPAPLWDSSAMSVLKDIMEYKNPLLGLILCNIQVEPKNVLNESRTAIFENMSRVCNRLIFKDVTILDLFNTQHQHGYVSPAARTACSNESLRIASGAVNVGSQSELLDCFEGAATNFADPKHHNALELVSKAIVEINSEHGHLGDTYRQSQLINVLKDWQKNDARFGPNTEWKHVQLAQLGANLLSLRNTTLSVLVCLAKRWKRDVDENYELDDEEEDDDSYDEENYYNGDSDAELADAYDGW